MLVQELRSVGQSVGLTGLPPARGTKSQRQLQGWQRRVESLMQGQPPPQTLASPPPCKVSK